MGRRHWRRAVLVLAIVGLLGFALRHVEADRVLRLLGRTPSLWLALLPYLVAQALDAGGLGWLLRRAGITMPFLDVLRIRLIADAVGTSLPSGQVIADGTALHLLKAHGPVPAGLSALASRKVALGLAHGTMLLLAAALGGAALSRASLSVVGGSGLEWVVAGTGLVVLAASGLGAAVLRGGQAARAALDVLVRLPVARLRAWARKGSEAAGEVDRGVDQCLGGALPRALGVVAVFVACMLVETFETYFILDRLQSGLTFVEVLSFESFLSLGRALAFVLPAGLGLQDLGYVAFLAALGVPDAPTLAAAFLVTKRGKEMVWILCGWLGLTLVARRASVAGAPATP